MSSPHAMVVLGNHQRCWIWGRNLVEITLSAGRWRILELRISNRLPDAKQDPLQRMAATSNIPVKITPPEELTRLCRNSAHQGMAAKMAPFPYRTTDETIGVPPCGSGTGPVLVLDHIHDDYNLGAIIRSGDVLGVQGICLAEDGQTGVTSLAARASAGAVNHVPVCRVRKLAALIDRLRSDNVCIVGASEKGDTPPSAIDWKAPAALIMGNETCGIDPALLDQCDRLARIPQLPGSIGSLNVAAAAAVLLYEAACQRNPSAGKNNA